jgi:hypothetical protein
VEEILLGILDRQKYIWQKNGPSRPEVEMAIAKLKKYKSPGSDQILAEMIQTR